MLDFTLSTQVIIDDKILAQWQDIADTMAELIGVPAALIMQVRDDHIEVCVASNSDGNPYHMGDKEHFFDSGLYCETVIRTREKLLVPHAPSDEDWKDNPDIKLNMVSYLGFPVSFPNGDPFGTICVLDNKENAYSELYERLLVNLRKIVEGHLELIYLNHALGEKYRELSDYLTEIRTLRGIIPICTNCKKIRNDKGFWQAVESYVSQHTEAKFSHGICPDCMKQLYPDF